MARVAPCERAGMFAMCQLLLLLWGMGGKSLCAPSDYLKIVCILFIFSPFFNQSLQFEFKWPLEAPAADFDRVDAVAQRLRACSSPN